MFTDKNFICISQVTIGLATAYVAIVVRAVPNVPGSYDELNKSCLICPYVGFCLLKFETITVLLEIM